MNVDQKFSMYSVGMPAPFSSKYPTETSVVPAIHSKLLMIVHVFVPDLSVEYAGELDLHPLSVGYARIKNALFFCIRSEYAMYYADCPINFLSYDKVPLRKWLSSSAKQLLIVFIDASTNIVRLIKTASADYKTTEMVKSFAALHIGTLPVTFTQYEAIVKDILDNTTTAQMREIAYFLTIPGRPRNGDTYFSNTTKLN